MRRRRRKRTHLPSIDTAVSGSRFDGLSPVFQRHLLLVAPRAPTTSPEATYCCSPAATAVSAFPANGGGVLGQRESPGQRRRSTLPPSLSDPDLGAARCWS